MSRRDEITTRMQQVKDRTEELEGYARLTRTQERELNALTREFADLSDELRSLDLERIRSAANGGNPDLKIEAGTSCGVYAPADEPSYIAGPAYQVRDQARRELDRSHRDGRMPDQAAATVERLLTRDGTPVAQTSAARWMLATGTDAYARAFAKKLADPEHGHLLWDLVEAEAWRTAEAFRAEMRAMSLTDSTGGFLIPAHLDPAVILTSDGSTNPIRQISRNVTIAGDTWNGVTSAGITAEWKAEAAEVADASPTLGSASIPVHFADAFVPFSFEVGMDAAGFMNELSRLLADALDQLHAAAFVTGSGSGQPTGIITALDGTSSEVTPTTAETFAAADVYKTQQALPPRWQQRAQWAADLSTLNTVAQFETPNGARLFPEIDSGRLLRKPLNEVSHMRGTADINDAATADNHILVYGDWSNYVIVTRIGSQLELVPHLFGENRRPTGQRGALLWARTGADVVNDSAFRVLNVATTA